MTRRIAQLIGTLNPEYGGPVRAAKDMSSAFVAAGVQSSIYCLDDPAASWLSDVGDYPVIALGPSYGRFKFNTRLFAALRADAPHLDAIVIHGIWQFQSLASRIASRLGVPCFTFVHGALDPWFDKAFPVKNVKKRVYWHLIERRNLALNSAILYTCQEEFDTAAVSWPLDAFPRLVTGCGILQPEIDVKDCTDAFSRRAPSMLPGRRHLLFLGRLHRKKGLDLLVDAFSSIEGSLPFDFVIAGPDESGLAEALKSKLSSRGLADRFHWTGMLNDKERWGALHSCEALVLPSRSENFGLVVPEALACSKPVLITDKVNIWREVQREGAGLVCSDTVEGVRAQLLNYARLSRSEIEILQSRAYSCFRARFLMDTAVERIISHVDNLSAV